MSQTLVPGVSVVRRYAPDAYLLDAREHFASVNVRPNSWFQNSTHVQREGAGPGSLTEDGLEYHVMTGELVEDLVPDLYSAYLDFLPAVEACLGKRLDVSSDTVSRLNVNMLKGKGGRYEPHVDSQPYTAILFASEHTEGGEFVFEEPPRNNARRHNRSEASYSGGVQNFVRPAYGHVVLFDGQRYPHYVSPLKKDELRITIPMVFVDPEHDEQRDHELSSHLYG